jgi:hypothetical protein
MNICFFQNHESFDPLELPLDLSYLTPLQFILEPKLDPMLQMHLDSATNPEHRHVQVKRKIRVIMYRKIKANCAIESGRFRGSKFQEWNGSTVTHFLGGRMSQRPRGPRFLYFGDEYDRRPDEG